MRQDFKTKILQLRCNAKFVFVGKITMDVKSKFQNEIHCFTSEVNDTNFDILHIQKYMNKKNVRKFHNKL